MEVQYKYKSLKEFRKIHLSECRQLQHSGLLDKLCEDMGWSLGEKTKPIGYWKIKENVLAEARKYSTRGEWAKGPNGGASSYNIAKENGWFDECVAHMLSKSKPSGFWKIKENVLTEAKKYSIKSEWIKKSSASYSSANKNGWSDECVAHMEIKTKPNGFWKIKENVLADARKYSTRSEWSKAPSSSYTSAKENGWFDECVSHMEYAHTPAGYWTKERCLEEAKRCVIYTKWLSESPNSYAAAIRDGYLDECLLYLSDLPNKWSKDSCLIEAVKYESISEWQKNSNGSLKSARRNGWLEECTNHMIRTKNKHGFWNKENVLAEAKKHNTLVEWRKDNQVSYNIALKNGWSDECTKHMDENYKPKGYWIKERCIEESKKYSNRSEWSKKSSTSYSIALKNDWHKECTEHMIYLVRPNGTWTKDLLLIEGKKWSTKKEWRELGEGYSRAVSLKCLEECTAHMVLKTKPMGYWKIKENVLAEARKYNNKTEWQENSNGSMKSARIYGWLEECTKHMK